MIGSTSLDLPAPNSGEEFELLMADLLEARYDCKTSRHGRSGQGDDAVDIYYTGADDECIGVQCKRIDKLTIQSIRSEVQKARAFKPALDQYIIATTAPQDKHLQEDVRQLDNERDGDSFSVDIWMWDDVERLLSRHDSVFQDYYGDHLDVPDVNLEDAEIYELTPGYFEQNKPRSPKTAWQSQFTLSEIQSGYTFDRLSEDGDSFATQLMSAVNSGQHIALCGEAGSGKSTILKQVCWRLYENEVPTLYCPDTSTPESVQNKIEEWVVDHEDGVIVIEDAHSAGFSTVFELVELCEQHDQLGILTAARELDPDSLEQGKQTNSSRPRPGSLEIVSVPPLSEKDVEAAIERYEQVTNSNLQVASKVVLQQLDRDPHSSSILSLVHLLSALDGNGSDTTVDTDDISILDADASALQSSHESECQHLVAIQTALLKASKLPLSNEFFHALTTLGYSHEEVDTALDALQGSILFGHDGDEYRTKHELWCIAYLEQALNEAGNTAVRRFERCINSTLQLPADPDLRADINSWHRREVVPLDIHEEYNTEQLLKRLFRPGLEYNQIVDYYGESQYSGIAIPEIVPAGFELHQYVWRGAMALSRSGATHGNSDFGWAQREYQTLLERLNEVDGLLEPTRHELESIALTNSAHIKKNQGEIEEAKTDLRQALELNPIDGPSFGKSTIHANLAELCMLSGDTAEAESYFRQACAIDRELGDRHSWAMHIGGLAVIYFDRGESKLAQACNKTAKRVFQEFGDLQALTHIYGRISNYLFEKGDHEAARELTKQSLRINRQLSRDEKVAEDLMTLGSWEIRLENPVSARRYTEKARSKFSEVGNERAVAKCDGNLANIEMLEENGTIAKYQQQDVIDRLEDLGDETALAKAHADLGNIHIQCGNLADGLPQTLKGAEMLYEVGEYRRGAQATINIAQILYQFDAELEAGSLFGTAMFKLLAGNSYEIALFALDHLVEIHYDRTNPKQTITLALQGWQISRREGLPYWESCFLARYHFALQMICPSLYSIISADILELLSKNAPFEDTLSYIERTAVGENETGLET